MWYAGIDCADEHHDVAVVDEHGRLAGRIRVAHSVEGLEQLTGFLPEVAARAAGGAAARAATLGTEQMACIGETNHGLPITWLLEAGFPVYPVTPKTLERRRSPAGAKTDALDASLLAKKGRADFAELRHLTPDSPLVQELKPLTRDQDLLVQSQCRARRGSSTSSRRAASRPTLRPGGHGPVRHVAPADDAGVPAALPDARARPDGLRGRTRGILQASAARPREKRVLAASGFLN